MSHSMDTVSGINEGPREIERRRFLTKALGGMVSAIISSQIKAGTLPKEEPDYINGLAKAEAGAELIKLSDEELESARNGKRTPKLVTSILERVLLKLKRGSLTSA
ncbi:MAG: hypothetical protein HHAS10_10910 [Candidatus Altimarinota bacterium]